ncbi:hypothetical protein [Mesorhizobium sp. CAU 1732]|uniref:hypothetical protein n=1 Tax=Mesorhizobium sp. CAU 1732 TaxID=3140358 RepID=UPI0032616431
MEMVRKVAVMCVARAVMFGTLGIGCTMFAFAYDPPAAFRCGAILTLMMAGILILKAHYVLRQKPRNTEVWIYLDERTRPREPEAVKRYAAVLREVYGQAARIAFAVSCALFVISALMLAAGMELQGFQSIPR